MQTNNNMPNSSILSNTLKDVDQVALSYQQLMDIEKQGGSAFYFLDLDKLRRNYYELEQAFTKRYPHCQIAYSFKTNYAPKICETLKKLGCWAEVVSEMEYDIATQRVGYDPTNIIVNGPVHEPQFIERALIEGALFNVDAWYLLDQVKDICQRHPNRQFRIGIRLTYEINEGGVSRFGIENTAHNLQRLADWQHNLRNCTIEGFHSHYSNSSRSLASFKSRITGLLKTSNAYFPNKLPQFINIGGGFFGDMPKVLADQMKNASDEEIPDFDAYANEVTDPLNKQYQNEDQVILFLEPGTALVANTMVFVCKVYDLKIVGGKTTALVNGSNHNINHKWQGEALPLKVVKRDIDAGCKDNERFDIAGNTCIEKDILRTDIPGNVEIGDYIIFQYMGGYTNVLKQPFINPCQPVYAWDKEELIIVKRQETVSDILASYE